MALVCMRVRRGVTQCRALPGFNHAKSCSSRVSCLAQRRVGGRGRGVWRTHSYSRGPSSTAAAQDPPHELIPWQSEQDDITVPPSSPRQGGGPTLPGHRERERRCFSPLPRKGPCAQRHQRSAVTRSPTGLPREPAACKDGGPLCGREMLSARVPPGGQPRSAVQPPRQ